MYRGNVFSLASLIDKKGEVATQLLLKQAFACPRNLDVERFLLEKAIDFEKRSMARTFLIVDREHILAYFSLSFKEIEIECASKTLLKKLNSNANSVKTFLM